MHSEKERSLSKRNPLLLTPVLQSLVKHLTLPELKTCRLVCSTWVYAFKAKFVSISKVMLESPPSDFTEVTDLLECIEARKHIFFSSLVLRLTAITEPILHMLSLCSTLNSLTQLHLEERYDELEISFYQMQNMFRQFGHNLIKLTMALPYSSYPITKLTSESAPLFPRLKTVQLIGYLYNRQSSSFFSHPHEQLIEFFTELFGNMPQLQQLSLDVDGESSPSAALRGLDNAPCASNLTFLETSGNTDLASLGLFKSLTKRAHDLKILKLFFWIKSQDRAACRLALVDLLKTLPKSVEEFHILGLGSGGYIFDAQEVDWIFQKEYFVGMKLIRVVLQLEAALCRFVGGIDPIRFGKRTKGTQIEVGKETKITLGYPGGDHELIGALSRCFPETVSLKGVIINGYPELWGWTALTTLDIILKPYEDEHNVNVGLLGTTAEGLRRLERNLTPLRTDNFVFDSSAPSIVNLTNLKVLNIEFRGSYSLDATGYFALAKMTWLDKLTIIVGDTNCLSYYCSEFIRKNLKNTTVLIDKT